MTNTDRGDSMNQDSAITVSKPMNNTRTHKLKNHSYAPLAGYLFISPWLIGFLILTVWPMIQSMYYTFTDFSLLSPPRWVGMQNFKEISEDRYFYNSLKVTFTFVLTSVPARLIFALLVALLLNKKIKGMGFYRTIIYLPSLIGGSALSTTLCRYSVSSRKTG
jgi:multiple sugar transport system permease protein